MSECELRLPRLKFFYGTWLKVLSLRVDCASVETSGGIVDAPSAFVDNLCWKADEERQDP